MLTKITGSPCWKLWLPQNDHMLDQQHITVFITHHSVAQLGDWFTMLLAIFWEQIPIQMNKFTLQPPCSLKNHTSLMAALLNVHHEKWHKIMQRHRTHCGAHGKVKSQWDGAGGWPGEAHLRVVAADGDRSCPSRSPASPATSASACCLDK